jgi:hypothetical protein
MNRRTLAIAVVSFLGVAGAIGAIVRAGGHPAEPAGASSATGTGAGGMAASSRTAITAPQPSPLAPGAPTHATFEAVVADQVGPRIVKEASLTLAVPRGTFALRFPRVVQIAADQGGFAEDSHTSVGRFRTGSVTIRVPVDRFEAALAAVRSLGTVRAETVSGQDVTARFVDLQARLRNWRAQEAVLLRLMSKATTTLDSIRVQDQLQGVQQNIEELTGELRLLSNQTAMSTIEVSMTENGLVTQPTHGSTLSKAWRRAVHGSVAVLAAVVVGLGYLIPVSILAAVVALVWFGLRRIRRTASQTA